MKTSSYLFMSNRRNISRKMQKHSSNSNDISVDSLEEGFKKKTSLVNTISDDNLETIAVPFYEQDVLVKIPKEIRRGQEKKKPISILNKDHASSYLVNKNMQSKRTSSYLEKFRKQFLPNHVENKPKHAEIRSLSPEVGDTERSTWSFGDDDINNPVEEFQNTEAYNEIYYDNLLRQEEDNYMGNSSDEGIYFNDDLENKYSDNNLRSVSEVSQPRRHRRRVTAEPIVNVKLGGLGPDLELVRPQLMRAKSVQRYSERVRAANRVSIYKKTFTEEKQSKRDYEQKNSTKKSAHNTPRQRRYEERASYLMNKSFENTTRKSQGSMSANPSKTREALATERQPYKSRSASKTRNEKKCLKSSEDGDVVKKSGNDTVKVMVKSSAHSKTIKTEIRPKDDDVSPIHISFLVNVENNNTRPVSALRKLEEKHRLYQEMVKQYVKDFS